MNLPAGLPIPQGDWERTPLSVRAVVIALWQENQLLKQQVSSLQQQVNILQAEVEKLGGRFGISRRDIAEALETIFHVEIGLGSIPAQEQAVSQAVKQPVEEAQEYVQTQPVVNLDETSWRQWTHNFWLWVSTTPSVTVFRVFQTRGAARAAPHRGLCAGA